MNVSDIFVFGSKLFVKETKRDAITSLPLELSWRIFSYLDDTSLRVAYDLHNTWARIISANSTLRRRLNRFNLVLKLGPNLAKFYRRNKRKMKNERNYQLRGETTYTTKKTVIKTKRCGDDIVIHTKRFKLF